MPPRPTRRRTAPWRSNDIPARLAAVLVRHPPRFPSALHTTFPQAILWGILGCVATFAISIVHERTTGTYQRLRIGPISPAGILAGRGLACFLTSGSVIVVLVLLGKLVFKVPIGSPALFVVAAVCTCLRFVGLMMLVSTLRKTEQSVGGAGWASLMILAMFGGGMIPLAFMPPWVQSVSHFSPIKWGILALEGGIARDFTLTEVLLPCGILVGLALAFFALGALILRRQ
jgi:ABC-2 type transport system permease protein